MDFRHDLIVYLLTALSVWALVVIYRSDRKRMKRVRGAYFEDCLALFSKSRITQDDVDFPVLEGTYLGYRARLQPIIDHMTIRKLPSLWLTTTIYGPLPGTAVIDFLVRPTNTEFYSTIWSLPNSLKIPHGWPAHGLFRTSGEDSAAVERIGPHIYLFDDPKMKEVVVTPDGVRLVYQAEEAERAHYMVLRYAKFASSRLDKATAKRLLDEAVALHSSVAESLKRNRPAAHLN
jgi:hypothetical protein